MIEIWIAEINNFLWTYIMVIVLIGTAIYFTIRSRFIQFRKIGEMLRVLGEGVSKETFEQEMDIETGKAKAGIENRKVQGVSSFQAFCISLASRVGTGNLAGVATAIAVGGPGAIFWMWVIALLGSVSALIESTLAQIFKKKGKHSFIGGPAYYIQQGLDRRWMAVLFAVCITVTFGLVFNSVQSNTIAAAFRESFGFDEAAVGVSVTILTAIIIFGGVGRIAKVSGIIVPLMAVIYIFLALVIVVMNITKIPQVISLIVSNAFGFDQIIGGGMGVALIQGIKRGLFSNEAGLGSAPNAAATAVVSHPVKQGLIQALGVFTDTLVICSCTAFIILLSDSYLSGLNGIRLTQAALSSEIGSLGAPFISIAIFFFAFTSVLGNYYYGEANILYFTRNRYVLLCYRLAVAMMVMVGALVSLDIVWGLADVTMAIMGLVNLAAILMLGNIAMKAIRDYITQRRAGIKSPVFRASSIPEIQDKIECWK